MLDAIYNIANKKTNLIARKYQIHSSFTIIKGASKTGKTSIIKQYLSALPNASYLYIDLKDLRIDKEVIKAELQDFCITNKIHTLVIEAYEKDIPLPNVLEIILSTEDNLYIDGFTQLNIYNLDFEEFLAFDSRYDTLDTAFTHFLQTSSYPEMYFVHQDHRQKQLQNILKLSLNPLELQIMIHSAKLLGQKVSAFQMFERLKLQQKLSKDMFYKTFYGLMEKGYLYWVEKFGHSRATKKLFTLDFNIKNVLTLQKDFSRLFETLVFLEMLKRGSEIYYADGIDFYLPNENRIVLTMPFSNEDVLFKKIESIEAFIIENGVMHVEVVTMNAETKLGLPYAIVEMMPFIQWAIVEGE
ncbi:ATP-binding protein [Sulfurimonas sp. MAG313]|nr:ATP-binding protein [Sulfurimonas sp. MAG313]MDF1881654.1 ATP-binding protein [Sulfurimonas sp. MAG313]